ncbi:hypothetical protein MTO96_027552 [Rhipicephalus appendiculatus]
MFKDQTTTLTHNQEALLLRQAFSSAPKFAQATFFRPRIYSGELMLWRKKWSKVPEADLPAGALGSLSMCNAEFFPTIHRLLGILATLPVSTSTPERTFSTLRRLKNYLRNRVQQERLTGMALLSVREVEVTPAQVLAEFCYLPRRKNFAV